MPEVTPSNDRTILSTLPPTNKLRAASLGLLAGLLNGLIALGGGVLITPMLVAAGVAPQIAVGTSLAAVTMLSSFGFLVHLMFVGVPLGVVPLMICVAGGIAGTWMGSKLLARITPQWMLMLFALVQIAVAIRLVDQGLGSELLGSVQTNAPPSWAYAALGLFSGTLSGLFGVGGGALVLLGLAAFYGVPVAEGLAIALALNVTNACSGLIHHARSGRVLWSEVSVLLPTAAVGIGVGAFAAHALPVDVMRIAFGGFFAVLGFTIGRKGWVMWRSQAPN